MKENSVSSRPLGKYCQVWLTKTVNNVQWFTIRWISEKIAIQGKPIGFRMDGSGEWSDGWSLMHKPDVIERPRVHSSWDERRISNPIDLKG